MDNFPLSKIRIEQYETILIEKLLKLLDRLYLPQIIQKFLKQRDLEGNSVLEKLARFNQFAVLQTKLVDRVVRDYWGSKIDVSGSLMDNSSAYTLIRYGDLRYQEDFEKRYRFYMPKNVTEKIKPHLLTFRVWAESIKLRYFIEMIIFAGLVLYFQVLLSDFNQNIHKLNADIEEM